MCLSLCGPPLNSSAHPPAVRRRRQASLNGPLGFWVSSHKNLSGGKWLPPVARLGKPSVHHSIIGAFSGGRFSRVPTEAADNRRLVVIIGCSGLIFGNSAHRLVGHQSSLARRPRG